MVFNLRRYFYALSQSWYWLVMALIPLAVYLLTTGMRADRYSLTRSLEVNSEYPVAVVTSPVDVTTIKGIITNPSQFFTDRLALVSWKRFAETDPGLATYNFKDKNTMLAAIETLSLKIDNKGIIHLGYFGPDEYLGTQLVDFYMNRLLSRMRAGFHRLDNHNPAAKKLVRPEKLQLDKTKKEHTAHHSWWRAERTGPAVTIFLLPVVIAMAIIAIREFLDPAFKSGRQAARYLDMPILGFMPSLDPIISNLREGEKNC